MAVLRIGVMTRMMARRLDQADTLEQGNYGTVFYRCPVRPFVDLVGVDSQEDDQPDLPGEQTAEPSHRQYPQSKTQQQPRTLKPSVTREIARVVVMQDVWFCDKPASNRPVLVAIGILEPVKQARKEVGHQHHSDELNN